MLCYPNRYIEKGLNIKFITLATKIILFNYIEIVDKYKDECFNMLISQNSKVMELSKELSDDMNNCIAEIIEELDNTINIDEDIFNEKVIIRKARKYEWIRKEKKSENSYYHLQLEQLEKANEFKKNLNMDTIDIDNVISEIDKKLSEWNNNEDSYLIQYPFLVGKKDFTIKRAFFLDYKIELLKKVYNQYLEIYNKEIDVRPNFVIDFPKDTTSKVELLKFEDRNTYKTVINTNAIQYVVELNDDEDTNYLCEKWQASKMLQKMLSDKDIDVAVELLNSRDPNFFENGIVYGDIADIQKKVFGRVSMETYDKVLLSLYRLKHMEIMAKKKDIRKGGASISFLDNYSYFNKNNKMTIQASLNPKLLNEIISGNVTAVYSDEIKRVKKNPDAKPIMFFLQKERLSKLSAKPDELMLFEDGSFCIKYEYTYFSIPLVLNNKRKDRVIKRLCKCFDIIVESDTILKKYERIGDYFTLYYKNLNDEELGDLNNRVKTYIQGYK